MLALVGIGLDTKDISVKSLEFLESADIILADSYTSIISPSSFEFIERETGKRVERIERADLEEKLNATVSRAKKQTLAILVIGDALVATTHHIIIDEARRQGVDTKVFHSSSIFSAAIGESGLDIYKFGPPVTIPFWSKNYKPTSFLDVIRKNLVNKQHSLVLLDLKQGKAAVPMVLDEAVKLLNAAEAEKNYGIINGKLKILIMGDVGKDTQRISYASMKDIDKALPDFAGKVISIIVPSDLSFAERDALSKLDG